MRAEHCHRRVNKRVSDRTYESESLCLCVDTNGIACIEGVIMAGVFMGSEPCNNMGQQRTSRALLAEAFCEHHASELYDMLAGHCGLGDGMSSLLLPTIRYVAQCKVTSRA